jgi:hypothetical protein
MFRIFSRQIGPAMQIRLMSLKRLTDEQIIPPVVSWLNVSTAESSSADKTSENGFRNYSLSEPVITPTWFAERQLVTVLCNVHNHSRTTVDDPLRLDATR